LELATTARNGCDGLEQGAEPIEPEAEDRRHHEIEAIEEDEFGKLREVADDAIIGRKVFAARHPADMRPPKAGEAGRMDVMLVVGVLMMVPMYRGPPQGPALHGGIAERGE
jgi:hypothetical protein